MIDSLSFQHESWLVPVVIAGLFIWLLFVWKELPTYGKARFFVRLLVALIVIVCLSLLILKPLSTSPGTGQNSVLLTENYHEEDLDSLHKMDQNLIELTYKENQEIIPDSLFIDTLFIAGNGINGYDFWRIENTTVKYIPGERTTNIDQINFKKNFHIGETLEIKGYYSGYATGNRLVLVGPAEISLDSVYLEDVDDQLFNFKTDLNFGGNLIYHLLEKDSLGKVLNKNPIAISVKELEPLQILILNSFPTFETKYLKNFLSDKGHRIVARSQLTKGRFKYEYFNIVDTPINTLSVEFLKDFDLIIIDYQSYLYLSTMENSAIKQAIRDNGLGMFVQPSPQLFSSRDKLVEFNYSPDYKTRTEIDSRTNFSYPKFGYRFSKSYFSLPIQMVGNDTVSFYKNYGMGRISSTLLQNTYELLLRGNENAYQLIWSDIINVTSKKGQSTSDWEIEKHINYPNERLDFRLRTSIPSPIVNSDEGFRIPLKQDLEIASLWHGTTFPKKEGWHKFYIEQDTTQIFSYFIAEPGDWESVKEFETIQKNKSHFNREDMQKIEKKNLFPINLIYFYIIFILGLGYLWMVPKLGNEKL